MFSKQNSINEILKTPSLDKCIFMMFPDVFLSMVPDNMKDEPLEVVEKNVIMPWGVPFMAGEFLYAANVAYSIVIDGKYRFDPLWKEAEKGYIPDTANSNKDSVCLIVRNEENVEKRPTVIICPGGGYETLSTAIEGIAFEDRLHEAGYNAFILIYRVKPNYYPAPQVDLALAIKYLKANADKYGVDPDNIMVMGSSAGGHVCATVAAYHKEIEETLMKELENDSPEKAEKYRQISIRPDKVCLNYPVINFLSEGHEPSFMALTDGNEELRDKLSIDLNVNSDYPKTFVWACEDDQMVPCSNAVRMGEALKKCGVECKLRTYPTGDHGCGLAVGTSAECWMNEMLEFMK